MVVEDFEIRDSVASGSKGAKAGLNGALVS
jgi:hypothetical protein